MEHFKPLIKLEEARLSSRAVPLNKCAKLVSENSSMMKGLEMLPGHSKNQLASTKAVTVTSVDGGIVFKCGDCFLQFKNEEEVRGHLLNKVCGQGGDTSDRFPPHLMKFYEDKYGGAERKGPIDCTIETKKIDGLVSVTRMMIPALSTDSLSNCYHIAGGRSGNFSFNITYSSK